MNYPEAIQFLHGLRQFGMVPGLDTTRRLAALAGDPHSRLRFIHVAGTNGKGSTCAMLESIYRAAGLRVGLYTSPHLVHFAERMQVNRQPVTDAEVARLATAAASWIEALRPGQPPTFFEVVTVMALRYFADQACDLVIWETGLGGRWDSTNIVTPLASVITNIQFDHQKWLGETLAAIAGEKAGIIKPGVPVITAADAPEALAVIRDVARSNAAPLTEVTSGDTSQPPLDTIHLPLLGAHQRLNAVTALATVRALAPVIPVSVDMMRVGLETTRWAGRLQLIRRGAQTILLDGAHNVAGAEALRAAWLAEFPAVTPALILGALEDKQWAQMCDVLAPLARRLVVTAVASDRTAQPAALADACRARHPDTVIECHARLAAALEATHDEPFIVITGSLYLVGEALELLGEPGFGARAERELNEWQPKPKDVDRPRP